MNVPPVNLKRQHESIRGELDEAIKEVIDNTSFILGPQVKAFEEAYSTYCDTEYCIGVASGKDALLLGLRALGIQEGDEVIVPANTFIATVLAASYVNATPVLVDIDPVTYTMDPEKVKDAITSKTKAIMPVHLYGHAVDMDPILELAKEHNLFVVEDCAQAQGAEYKGKKVGGLGDVAGFSFYPAKNLGAFGDAGGITTNNAEVDEKVRVLRDVGQTVKYHHDVKGYNSRLDSIQAAVLGVKLKQLDGWNDHRRELAEKYNEELADLPLTLPQEAEWAHHVYYVYTVRTKKRDELLAYLKEKEIYCQVYYPIPIHLLGAYEDLGYKRGDFPVTEEIADEIIALPAFPGMHEDEQAYVINTVKEFFNE